MSFASEAKASANYYDELGENAKFSWPQISY